MNLEQPLTPDANTDVDRAAYQYPDAACAETAEFSSNALLDARLSA